MAFFDTFTHVKTATTDAKSLVTVPQSDTSSSSLSFYEAVKLALSTGDSRALEILLSSPDYSAEDKRHAQEEKLLKQKLASVAKERYFFEKAIKILTECQVIFKDEKVLRAYRDHFNKEQKSMDLFLHGEEHFKRLKLLADDILKFNQQLQLLKEQKNKPDIAFVDNQDKLDEKESLAIIQTDEAWLQKEINIRLDLEDKLKNIHCYPELFKDENFDKKVAHLPVWQDVKKDLRYKRYHDSLGEHNNFVKLRESIREIKIKFSENGLSYRVAIDPFKERLAAYESAIPKDFKENTQTQGEIDKEFVFACLRNRIEQSEIVFLERDVFKKFKKKLTLVDLLKEAKNILESLMRKLEPIAKEFDFYCNNYKKIKLNYIKESVSNLLSRTFFLDRKIYDPLQKEKLLYEIINQKLNLREVADFLVTLKLPQEKYDLMEFLENIILNNKDANKVTKFIRIKEILRKHKESVNNMLEIMKNEKDSSVNLVRRF